MSEHKRIKTLIGLLREKRFLEYKESMPWDIAKDKVAKTAMGMANIRDGGTIIFGVSQRSGQFQLEGMNEEHLSTFNDDDIQAHINRFADPYVQIESHQIEMDGKKFLAIVVFQFDEVPVICKRNGTGFREGAIYTRSNRLPETCEVQSQTEMREIIAMAADKETRNFLKRLGKVGFRLGDVEQENHSSQFEQQLGEL